MGTHLQCKAACENCHGAKTNVARPLESRGMGHSCARSRQCMNGAVIGHGWARFSFTGHDAERVQIRVQIHVMVGPGSPEPPGADRLPYLAVGVARTGPCKLFRMHQMRDQLQTVDEARARACEIGVGIDCIDPVVPDRG